MSDIPPPPPPPPSLPSLSSSSKYKSTKPAPAATKASNSGEDLLSQLKSGKNLKKVPVDTILKSNASEPNSKAPAANRPQLDLSSIIKHRKNDASDRTANEPAVAQNLSKRPAVPPPLSEKPATLDRNVSNPKSPYPTPSPSKPNDMPLPPPRTTIRNQPPKSNSQSNENSEESQNIKVSSRKKPVPPLPPVRNNVPDESIVSRVPQSSPPQTPPRIKAATITKDRNSYTTADTEEAGLENSGRKPPPLPSVPILNLNVAKNTSQESSGGIMSSNLYVPESEIGSEETTLSSSLMFKINLNPKSNKKSSKSSAAVDSSLNASSTDLFKSRFKFPSDIAPPTSFVNFPKVYASKVFLQSRQN